MNLEQESQIISPETIEKIKNEIHYLIREHCNAYNIVGSHYKLFLHNSTAIEFDRMKVTEIERFMSLVKDYWDYFPNLISNLSFENITNSVESSNQIIGIVDAEKTKIIRNNQGNRGVVCSVYSKNLFIPENIFLGAVLLTMNLLSSKFLYEGTNELIDDFKPEVHGKILQQIVEYTGFLLKDKFVTKLVDYYIRHYENVNQLLNHIETRINVGRIHHQYKPLLRFIVEWKKYQWILRESTNSLREALTPYFDSIRLDKLYEMWVFYKTLQLFEPVKQKSHGKFFNSKSKIEIEYQYTKKIGWILEKPETLNQEVFRRPDVLVRKNGKLLAIIDAKCMKYSEEISDDKQEPGPNRDIVNQMIIYLDYGARCNLGIVLFADDKIRDDILIKQDKKRKIVFLNCYPYGTSSGLSFEKIKKYCM